MKLLLAALALAGLAAPIAMPAAAQAAPSTELDRLTQLLVPEATMLQLARSTLDNDVVPPAIAARYAANPGMQAHVDRQVHAEVIRIVRRELPTLRAAIAAIVSESLTPPEIADAAIFFASPTGQKLYAAAIASLAARSGMTDAQAREAAMNAATASATQEDLPVLIAFGSSGAAAKMSPINARVGTASRAWADRVVAENGDRLRALRLRAADEFASKGGR